MILVTAEKSLTEDNEQHHSTKTHIEDAIGD